jgi:uncharacterized protein YjbJ (UPF0337 family)
MGNPTVPTGQDTTRQAVNKEIQSKWNKFSDADLATIKGRDELVTQVVSKYGQEKDQVQRDVDALLKGRTM